MELDLLKPIVKKWAKTVTNVDAVCSSLGLLFGNIADSPVMDSVGRIQCEYTKAVSEIIDDKASTLEWFWLENDMGYKCQMAGFSGNMRQICNIDDLCNLLVEYSERGVGDERD